MLPSDPRGKSQTPLKFCADHCECVDTIPSVTPPDSNYFRSKSKDEVQLPDSDDSSLLVGCKKSANLNRFYDRTAGVLAVVRPCGVRRDVHV